MNQPSRIPAALLGLACVAGMLLAAAGPAAAAGGPTVAAESVTATLHPDGATTLVERVEVDYPAGSARFWTWTFGRVVSRLSYLDDQVWTVSGVGVRFDGTRTPTTLLRGSDGSVYVYAGDQLAVSGRHTWQLTLTRRGLLAGGGPAAAPVLDVPLTAGQQAAARATVGVRGAGGVRLGKPTCTVSPPATCTAGTGSGGAVTAAATDLAATGTLQVAVPVVAGLRAGAADPVVVVRPAFVPQLLSNLTRPGHRAGLPAGLAVGVTVVLAVLAAAGLLLLRRRGRVARRGAPGPAGGWLVSVAGLLVGGGLVLAWWLGGYDLMWWAVPVVGCGAVLGLGQWRFGAPRWRWSSWRSTGMLARERDAVARAHQGAAAPRERTGTGPPR